MTDDQYTSLTRLLDQRLSAHNQAANERHTNLVNRVTVILDDTREDIHGLRLVLEAAHTERQDLRAEIAAINRRLDAIEAPIGDTPYRGADRRRTMNRRAIAVALWISALLWLLIGAVALWLAGPM